MLVVLNPRAGGGKSLHRWRGIESRVRGIAGPFDLVVPESRETVVCAVLAAVARGERVFVAAGGDGTVSLIASLLYDLTPTRQRHDLVLGAIGLGSSNDFHKPFRLDRVLDGTPYRLDVVGSGLRDVGLLDYTLVDGNVGRRVWLANASVGITADANALFNDQGGAFRRLKRRLPPAAMAWAACRGILRGRARELRLAFEDEPATWVRARNVSVVKNPHVAGVLHYDSPYELASGELHLHVVNDVSLPRLCGILSGLARGRFTGQPGTWSRSVHQVSVAGRAPFPVEADGEVVVARRAVFSVAPHRIEVCA
jgi:diacylglycerol kinase family enzyme